MEFDACKITNEIVNFIRNYYKKNNLKGAIIGVSGGKDSSIVLSLFTLALGKKNVKGIWMPCHSNENDKKDAQEIANFLDIELLEFDLTDIYDNYVLKIKNNYNVLNNDLIDSNINIKPRLRMLTLYYFAAMLSKLENGTYIVPGTSNKCEIYTGYFTKGGDNVCDIQILSDLTVDEVIKIGDYLHIPYHLCHKTPHDGLSNKTDEEKLGVKYRDISQFIKEKEQKLNSSLSSDTRKKILKLHKNNTHKYKTPAYRK